MIGGDDVVGLSAYGTVGELVGIRVGDDNLKLIVRHYLFENSACFEVLKQLRKCIPCELAAPLGDDFTVLLHDGVRNCPLHLSKNERIQDQAKGMCGGSRLQQNIGIYADFHDR